jgi:hypothetical protein
MSPSGVRTVLGIVAGFTGASAVFPVLKLVGENDLVRSVEFWVWLTASIVLFGVTACTFLLPGSATAERVKDDPGTREKLRMRHDSTVVTKIDKVEEAQQRLRQMNELQNARTIPGYRGRIAENHAEIDALADAIVADDEEYWTRWWVKHGVLVIVVSLAAIGICFVLLTQSAATEDGALHEPGKNVPSESATAGT